MILRTRGGERLPSCQAEGLSRGSVARVVSMNVLTVVLDYCCSSEFQVQAALHTQMSEAINNAHTINGFYRGSHVNGRPSFR